MVLTAVAHLINGTTPLHHLAPQVTPTH